MNKQILVMKYHPAKKDVEFQRFQNGHNVPIRPDSRLMQYMKQKGKFVLQDHGNSFFDDIANAFDGLKSVDIQVITTKLDYEDLVQMVDLYNAQSEKCKINLTSLIELPDMATTYLEVKKYGEQAASILASHRQKLYEVDLKNDQVKQSADSFARQIHEEIQNIKGKIDSLSDNRVSLCFAGVYSAGKSALINAIMGYRILPESIKSETAKMFKVCSPKPGENVKIGFTIFGVTSEIEWNPAAQCFEFSKGPSESVVRTEIQKVMNDVKESRSKQHEQIYKILQHLNGRQDGEIASEVTILFPIPLDSEKVQFVIYDTPGTDSNYREHQQILSEALEEQSQSILIFVVKPDGLEGEGNNVLLDHLRKAEENNSRTSIDLGRSLFIINKADTQTADARRILQQQTIKSKDDDTLSIKLSDKKLFFISARYGYAAKAVINGIATDEDRGFFEAGKVTLEMDVVPTSFCYRQNRCATSENATGKMLEKCDSALAEAKGNGDEPAALSICAGLYALEQEIMQYGEKYAAAVKAFAIIDSVDRALSKLANRAKSLRDSNQEQISDIQRNIDQLTKTITSAIAEAYGAMRMSPDAIPSSTLKALKLDPETLNGTIVGHTKDALKRRLKGWFFGLGKVKVKDKDKKAVRSIIDSVFKDFTDNFRSVRQNLLERQRDSFMAAVQKAISGNGEISDSAKKYFLDVPKPSIKELDQVTDVGKIYDSHRRTDKVLLFDVEYLDKDGFVHAVEERLLGAAGEMRDEYVKEFCKSLETLLMQIKSQFELHLSEYSLNMKALIQNRDAMMALGDRIATAAVDLVGCQEQLNQIIWKEKENV